MLVDNLGLSLDDGQGKKQGQLGKYLLNNRKT